MDKDTLQNYYSTTKNSLLDNVKALKSLLHQAAALSDAIQKLHSLEQVEVPPEVITNIEDALDKLYDSIGDMADKIEKLFEDYQKLSEELFPN